MDKNTGFSYTYSAATNREVLRIRNKYIPKEISKVDMLRMLDSRVQSAGLLPGLILGIIGCLIFGLGMCIGLHAIPGEMWLAVLIGILGGAVMLLAYPAYRYISRKVKAELAPRILELSDEIIHG